MMDAERLRTMANQIARNFAIQGEEAAIAATVRHIIDFWDPRMKAAILADVQGEGRGTLSPVAAAAIARLTSASTEAS
jgi:formate dehydrogenase subunit delta